jgi:hypothetical protein
MIRTVTLMALIASLAACAQYREPTVDCFPFVAVTSGETECDFFPLGGPGEREDIDA